MRVARSPLRWGVFLAGLGVSIVLTVVFWPNALFLALVLPFLPMTRAAAEPTVRRCPRCGWSSIDPSDAFCPRDAEPLA